MTEQEQIEFLKERSDYHLNNLQELSRDEMLHFLPAMLANKDLAAYAAGLADAAPKWLPIESAPRGSGEDGPSDTRHPDYVEPPRLLLWTSEGHVVGYYDWYYHEGYGQGAEPGVSAWQTEIGQAYNPTHWIPLPAAPEPKP